MTSISHTRIIRNLNFWWSPPRRLLLLVGALIRYTLLSQPQQMHSFYLCHWTCRHDSFDIPFLLHQPTTLLLNWIAEINKQISWLWLKTQNKGNKHSNFLITTNEWFVLPPNVIVFTLSIIVIMGSKGVDNAFKCIITRMWASEQIVGCSQFEQYSHSANLQFLQHGNNQIY